MRILFFGIYEIGLRSLTELSRCRYQIAAVITKPATEADHQPVADFAASHGIPVWQPGTLKGPDVVTTIQSWRPDLIVVSGFDKIIPPAVLVIPPMGAINVHGSLLPAYRGPCPWKHQIANGDEVSGVTIHFMTAEVDTGGVLAQQRVPISADDTGGTLFHKLCSAGANLLLQTVRSIEDGNNTTFLSDESTASYFGYPTEADTHICWNAPAVQIRNLIRGMCPRPGAWTYIPGTHIRVRRATLDPGKSPGQPGKVIDVTPNGYRVTTNTSDLLLSELAYSGAVRHLNSGDCLF